VPRKQWTLVLRTGATGQIGITLLAVVAEEAVTPEEEAVVVVVEGWMTVDRNYPDSQRTKSTLKR